MFGNYLPNYFRFDRSYASVAIEPEIKWVCPSTMIQGPIACFTSEDEFCVAALDGLVYKCRIGEGNIEI